MAGRERTDLWRRATALLVACALVVVSAPVAAAQTQDADAVADRVTAEGAVLWDPLDGRVLWGRAPDASRRMASTTKIMTALLAVEAGTIGDTVRVSATAAAAFGAHVFAEEVATGRVAGGNIVNAAGNYRIDGLPPGQYRVVVEHLDEPVLASPALVDGTWYWRTASTLRAIR